MPAYHGVITLNSTDPQQLSEFYDNPTGEINEYMYLYLASTSANVIIGGNENLEFTAGLPIGMPIIKDCWHPIDWLNNQEELWLLAESVVPAVEVGYIVITRRTS